MTIIYSRNIGYTAWWYDTFDRLKSALATQYLSHHPTLVFVKPYVLVLQHIQPSLVCSILHTSNKIKWFTTNGSVRCRCDVSIDWCFIEYDMFVRICLASFTEWIEELNSLWHFSIVHDLRRRASCPWVKKMIETHCKTRFFRKECVPQHFFSHKRRFTAVISWNEAECLCARCVSDRSQDETLVNVFCTEGNAFHNLLIERCCETHSVCERVFLRSLKKPHFKSFSTENLRNTAVRASILVSFSKMSAITLHLMDENTTVR